MLSLLSHTLVILAYAVCGTSLVAGLSWSPYFVAVPVVMLLHVLPISLGGLGVREAGTVGMLVWLGADQQQALALSLVLLGLLWLSVLPGLLLSLVLGVSWGEIKESSRATE